MISLSSQSGRILSSNKVLHGAVARASSLLKFTPVRHLQSHESSNGSQLPPNFAFAFDIDGVLLRSSQALPRARKALSFLQERKIPFILLTNGGGKSEADRVKELSQRLGVPLDMNLFIQSHTPFAQLVNGLDGNTPLRDKCVLVTGGDGDRCRRVAEEDYGFQDVITPGDIIRSFPTIWPFASPQDYASVTRPLRKSQLAPRNIDKILDKSDFVKVDAVMIFNDPRDWALDTQIILDLLLSHAGYLGSVSNKNGDSGQPNSGYQQDSQPALYFSNPDLLWAAAYHLPRLGQGGFREALEGVWSAVTGGEKSGVQLKKFMFGKPHHGTYDFAEKRLQAHYRTLGGSNKTSIRKVYMVGDNPESDILGANQYQSSFGSSWHSILVRSGVYSTGMPNYPPKAVVDDVWDAVQWAIKDAQIDTTS